MKRAHPNCSPEEYDRRWLATVMRRTVTDEKGCILFQGFLTHKGYGYGSYRGRSNSLHRLVYQVVKGVTLTKDQQVCHSCDVRRCINVDHLWIGTNFENQEDARLKGRKRMQSATHCLRGHEYNAQNTYYHGPRGTNRSCKLCKAIVTAAKKSQRYDDRAAVG